MNRRQFFFRRALAKNSDVITPGPTPVPSSDDEIVGFDPEGEVDGIFHLDTICITRDPGISFGGQIDVMQLGLKLKSGRTATWTLGPVFG